MDNLIIVTQTDPETDMVYKQWGEYGYDTAVMFKDQPLLLRAIRRAWLMFGLPGGEIWCSSWVNSLGDYSTIILHANKLSGFLPSYLEKKYPNLRIIYWYWNHVDRYTNPERIKQNRTEFWTFNFHDCQKYGMRYNIQYYYEVFEHSNMIKSDLLFVGHDHGRLEKLNRIREMATLEGLRCDFRIIRSKQDSIPYSEVREIMASTRAIVEVNQTNSDGYTLRPLESLFFGKKLITYNEKVKYLPFYSSDNMYIVDEDQRTLQTFLSIPYDASVSEYKKDYDINAWIGNFFEKT